MTVPSPPRPTPAPRPAADVNSRARVRTSTNVGAHRRAYASTSAAAAATATSAAGSPRVPLAAPGRTFGCFVIEGQAAERAVIINVIRREPALTLIGEAGTTAEADLAIAGLGARSVDVFCVSALLDGGRTDSWQYVRRLREQHPESRVLMVCPWENTSVLTMAAEHGVIALHATRDSFRYLRTALYRAANGTPYLSPTLRALQDTPPPLNPRQQEVLTLMSQGASRPEIARRLGISEATVRSHTKLIFQRLGVRERAHAVAVGIRTGIIP